MSIAVLVDVGVVVILLISAGVSFFRGLIREVLTIVGVLGGGFAALTFGGKVLPLVSGWYGIQEGKDPGKLFDIIPMGLAAQITAYAGIFILVFIILQLASHLISSAARAVGLGPVDRTLGVFFGLARGLLLLGVLYLPFHLILPDDSKKEWFEKSQTMVFVEATTQWLISFVPQSDSAAKDKEDTDKTRDKLKAIDILGDKRIKQETDQSQKPNESKSPESSNDGYNNQTRDKLENLIENQIEQQVEKTIDQKLNPSNTRKPNE